MIEVKNLSKKYANHLAVSDLSFTVEDNCVYGFLGPNGAGKSTTMNIITGCLSATSGDVIINGHDIFQEPVEAKRCIGYLPEIPPLYPDMTPLEYLEFVAEAKNVKKEDREEQINDAICKAHIENVKTKLIKSLSKGYRQRVGIAQALIGNPEIIILDEPTVGLDPKQITEIRELIKELGKEHTVILSSHILSEIEAVCEKILIISNGRLVACDTPEKLVDLYGGKKKVDLTVLATEEEAQNALSGIEGLLSVKSAKISDSKTKIQLTMDRETDISNELFFAFSDIKKPIVELTQEIPTLEAIFLKLTAVKNKNTTEVKQK